ncbi:hypothetical protein DB88DRAFT_543629 [Papiliotrema laurentii]|uniref:RING-type domain-containing protein n=1 Tax=Papiliotrema laurentii TaxID=5418 RepID=A0AAD9FW20_PAPLA|nr:hypothetical protein DB88DRAFT_543629 [Papiliotrema laurentii]
MPPQPDPFWLCHECGAQMRPINRDGVNHCASCDGEFLEILDQEINPDPYHELPPQPPVRPHLSPSGASASSSPDPGEGAAGGFMQSLLGGLFGAAVADGSRSSPTPDRSGNGRGGGGGHTYSFAIGDNGRASVTFGSFGGAGPMGPFGPVGGDRDDAGLESFFPGFGAPPGGYPRPSDQAPTQRPPQYPQGGPDDQMHPEDLINALMRMFMDEGAPGFGGPNGPRGAANLGDYVMTEHGFNDVLEHLMQAAGPQGPIPASEVVIKGLPRYTLTETTLAESPFKDCPVCKDDFEIGQEVMRIPCTHIFHPDCLEPWLRTNGSCPVCRFSLVPEEDANTGNTTNTASDPSQQSESQAPQPPASGDSTSGGSSIMTNVLRRLWGQSGTSNPSTPAADAHPTNPFSPPSSAPATPPAPGTPPVTAPHSGLDRPLASRHASDQNNVPPLYPATDIPEDYRQRHRDREEQLRREQQQQQQQQQQQGDGPPLHEDLD